MGLVAARRLREEEGNAVSVSEASGEGAALMAAWQGAETVILIDAVHSGAAPGTLHRFDAHRHPLPAGLFRHSTHAFGVARTLGQLPPRLVVYGIEGESFRAGRGLSAAVEQALAGLIDHVRQELAACYHAGAP